MTQPRQHSATLPLRARRIGHAVLGRAAPGLAGRRATDVFSDTRKLGTRPDDTVPLGARRFEVTGCPDIRGGYLWGEAGPVALLVHGWGIDSSAMHALVPPLRAQGYLVAAFDAPAHGICPGSQATMTQYTRAAGAVIDTLGDVRVVVAHSLGSIAAVGAIAARPELTVDSLTLIAPTAALAGVLERWSVSELRLRRPIVERIYAELHARNGVPVSHWDVIGLGAGLDCPVLAIHDPGDDVVPFSEARAVAAGLRNVRLAVTPGLGHMGILMAPAVLDLVSEFVAGHARSTADQVPGS
jgi:pimeloyl-ACP methyl ester carboxylesterase